MPVFLNSSNELRTGWKLIAFIVVLIPVWIATGLVVTLLSAETFIAGDPLLEIALNVLISIVPAVITSLFAMRVMEHRRMQTLGVGLHAGWARHAAAGIAVSGGLLSLLMLGTLTLGTTHLEWTAAQGTPGRMVLTIGMLMIAAAFEELIFRGYPLQILMKGIGTWPAMIFMSCIFGLLHAQNPNSSPLGVFNTIVAGMMLSLAYLKTRSLWFPYGLHLAWNVGLGMVVGFPLSGLSVGSLWTTHVTGSAFLLGGEYGPEGGALGTLVFLCGAVAVWKLPIQSTDNYL